MIIHASVGTLYKLGIRKGNVPAGLKTAYLLLDGRCQYNCLYCTHSFESSSRREFLSRVLWLEISLDDLVKSLKKDVFSRICLQVVSYKNYKQDLLNLLKALKSLEIPISISVRVCDIEEVKQYFEAGAERIGIAIDVANEDLYRKIRGGNLKKTLNLIEEAAQLYPGKISTHLIVGLGETDREIVQIIERMSKINVAVALFAFTPVKGSKLENHTPPSLERYRKIQLARWLIFEGKSDSIIFENDAIVGFKDLPEDYQKAFLTSGCPDCTRPYYNEKPGKYLYNIHAEELLNGERFIEEART
ncbi:radical SAM protein [Pseudothermotoga thermarum]|uniref:Radical SAM domain protein n=1 Tax=Pseudothermotoga thermarum DSM 5069 TaxID=688269 RepID=F7YUF1_9THEM|nr:radical SAM protein [Pseudothermotoga thermarum]AEH51353.1 Radical SAM domain protein [Pseudothermotoga thermarum DSM 5069]